VIKRIEQAVHSLPDDPQYLQALPKLSSAHARIATAWRRATRPDPQPLDTIHLGPAEESLLRELFALPLNKHLLVPTDDARVLVARDLSRFLLVQFANVRHAVFWGADMPEFCDLDPWPRMAIRLLPRGEEYCQKILVLQRELVRMEHKAIRSAEIRRFEPPLSGP